MINKSKSTRFEKSYSISYSGIKVTYSFKREQKFKLLSTRVANNVGLPVLQVATCCLVTSSQSLTKPCQVNCPEEHYAMSHRSSRFPGYLNKFGCLILENNHTRTQKKHHFFFWINWVYFIPKYFFATIHNSVHFH